jgi:hypothetical protein
MKMLVEDVGLTLLQRCQSIWLVTQREVECPRCEATFSLCAPGSWKMLTGVQTYPTQGCGWETTAERWHESWRHHDLLGNAALGAVETYLDDYPQARTIEEKIVCIDQLIHSFHISLQVHKPNRSFAKPGRVDKERWWATIDQMYIRRRGQE